MKQFGYIYLALLVFGCSPNKKPEVEQTQFKMVPASQSGIDFRNVVDDLGERNIYNTYYIYNGGGVAAGDIDNDGLQDLLFSSNQNGCRLYRNLGNFVFEDITEAAGINYPKSWTTGVCMTDINADGFVDIHISRSGLASDTARGNLVFINNQNGTFSEQSKEIGLHDEGPSNQIYFFDYDGDEDLDAYVINHPLDFENAYKALNQVSVKADSLFSNRFYINNNGHFVESNNLVGLGWEKGFSLSASIGDLNGDGTPDIYVANDFISPDHFYANMNGAQFENRIGDAFKTTSMLSMGSDMADVNNDGRLDLFVADMEPRTHYRRKNYDMRLDKGFYDLNQRELINQQYTRNMFFLGSESGFKEVARMAGISMTDWSWAVLFEDLDNDGLKDLFVTNGTKRDIHNVDFIALTSSSQRVDWLKKHNLQDFITNLPINLLSNYGFKNLNGVNFENATTAWGLDQKLNGQGACIVDLDNDGALDIVVNNSDADAGIYRNTNKSRNNFLQVKLEFKPLNRDGIGSTVEIWTLGSRQMKTLYLSRGFQSSQPSIIHFGLADATTIDSLIITWPNGSRQKQIKVNANQRLKIDYSPNSTKPTPPTPQPLFRQKSLDKVVHTENSFDEFRRDRIVPFGESKSGPVIAKGDLNNDGREDLIVGCSVGNELQVFFQTKSGEFERSNNKFKETIDRESTAILTIDLDNDGDLDLYIGNGSNEGWAITDLLQDLVYLNNGSGNFKLAPQFSTERLFDTRCAIAADFNKDGFDDIFLGGGFIPAGYGWTRGSRILFNTGTSFNDVTEEFAPELMKLQSIRDAQWLDIDGDGNKELITTGHWEDIKRFEVKDEKLQQANPVYAIRGLWNKILFEDLDGDGDLDLIAGNHGLNTLFTASTNEPLELYTADFDNNGVPDPIVTHSLNHEKGTFIDRKEYCEKMPEFNNKFLTNKQFSEAPMDQVIAGKNMEMMQHLMVTGLETVVLLNDGKNNFQKVQLPPEVQFAPVKSIHTLKNNQDGIDIFLAGNSNSEFYDQGDLMANHGCLLRYASGEYKVVPANETGINITGVVNSSLEILVNGEKQIVLGLNNSPAQLIQRINR